MISIEIKILQVWTLVDQLDKTIVRNIADR